MPNRIYFGGDSSGIDVTWTKTRQRLDIGGWHHGCVGIEGGSMNLREFFGALGITAKDCEKAFREERQPIGEAA